FVSDVRPPARGPRARVPAARAAAGLGGGRVERRRAAAAGVCLRPSRTAARPRAHPRVGRSGGSLHGDRPALRRCAGAVLRVDDRLRDQAPRLAPPSAAAPPAAAPLPPPSTGYR